MELTELARLGDTIMTEVTFPQLGKICLQLLTPEACAYGNDLLMDAASGWRLLPQSRRDAS